MKCLNHPNLDAVGACMFCRNVFCEGCLENVGERKLCLDCVEAMAESSIAIKEKSFLSTKQMAAGGILVLLGFAVAARGLYSGVRLVQELFFSKSASVSLPGEIAGLVVEALKALAYLASGYGILLSESWSYWLGLALSIGTIIFAMYSLLSVPSKFGVLLLTASATALILIVMSWGDGQK